MKEIVMLGTGHATVTHCYNTCFVVRNGNDLLMVDAGGGNGVLRQLELADININGIHHLFVTHAHTDHILGVVWVIRIIMQRVIAGKYHGKLHVYGNDKVMKVINAICDMTLHKNYSSQLGNDILLHQLNDGDSFKVGSMSVKCFDILSEKEKQYGFSLTFDDGKKLVCMGDEPCNDKTLHFAQNADWMMCEAFCLYEDRGRFHPYEKFHSTALDAGRVANSLQVGNLIIYHTEDTDLPHRKEKYGNEVRENYKGNVYVPDDLEIITL